MSPLTKHRLSSSSMSEIGLLSAGPNHAPIHSWMREAESANGSGLRAIWHARRHAEEQLRKAAAEKEPLLREVHHRVKNNLPIIDGLLRLQSDVFPDPRFEDLIRDTSSRVHVIAENHQL